MFNIDNYPNILTIGCDGLGFDSDSQKEAAVIQRLKKAGLKFQPCVTVGEFKNKVICSFQGREEDRELTIKFAHQEVHPNLAALVIKILTEWGYYCRLMKTGSDDFLEFPPPEIFYEKNTSAMMRSQ